VGGSAKSQVVSKRCTMDDPNQAWLYDEVKKSLTHKESGQCLTVGWRDYLYIEDCVSDAQSQWWVIDFRTKQVNHTKDSCMTTSPQEGAGSKVRDCSKQKRHNKRWLLFNDVFRMEVVDKDTYTFRNSKDMCLAVGAPPELNIFAGPLSDNRHVVLLLNRDNTAHDITLEWKYLQSYSIALDVQTQYVVRDLYERRDMGRHKGSFTSNVDPHSVFVASLTPVIA